jgi:enoyl-CoA hydratase
MIPDAGLTYRLAHAPGRIGSLIGLTGQPVGASDVLAAGLADGMIEAAGIADLRTALANPFAGPVGQVIRARLARPDPGELLEHRALIERAFAATTVRALVATLERDASPFAARVVESLSKRSPLALEVLNRAIACARTARTLDEAMPLEYRLVCRMSEGSDAAEGVRALLDGGARQPSWRPQALADVDPALVEELFTPMLPGEELVLRPQA